MGTPFRLLEELYADEQMRLIWSADQTIATWLLVEAHLARAQATAGLITDEEASAIAAVANADHVNQQELWQAARNVGYPILGLVRQVASGLPDGPNGRVHFGATTQDIMDTALSLQLVDSCNRLEALALELGGVLSHLVEKFRETVMAARTHGQQAVPTTFGAKMAVFLEQVTRNLARIRDVRQRVAMVSLFGAGGTNAAMGPKGRQVRELLAGSLGLNEAHIPWHVAREGIVEFGLLCSMSAGVCVRLAREVVDLSRNEIAEVSEEIAHHRGASSTMPQKANPIYAESIVGFGIATEAEGTGLIRALESEHERSAGEWQAEWLLLPQVAEHCASALALSVVMIRSLNVNRAAMARNLDVDSGLLMAEAFMMSLAVHVGRERAHDLVYEAAGRCRSDGSDLLTACHRVLTEHGLPVDWVSSANPSDYLGEALSVCSDAIARWHAATGITEAVK